MKRFLTVLLLCGLLVGGLGWWYVRAAAEPAPGYHTAAVHRGDLSATISATGTLEPEEVVDIGAQVAGMIQEFGRDPRDSSRPVDYGTPVEAGTVLARIDPAVYQAQVDQAKANLLKAQADMQQLQAKVRQTERDWDRARQLGRSPGVISGVDYDTAQATYETAKSALAVGQAAIAQAEAALHQAEINLGYCTIKSPVKGVVVDRRVNVGQTVVSSLNAPSLFLIAKDLTRMQIWASVNEADIGQIHTGQVVRFTVDAFPNQVFQGTVAQVRLNATMTQNVVTYTVVVNTDNAGGKLLPYMTANLQFEVSRHTNTLLVPNTALRWHPQPQQIAPDARGSASVEKSNAGGEHPGRGVVWVEDGPFVRPVPVHTGLTDGVETEIAGGKLSENDTVVVGMTQAGAGKETTNPFTPQLFGGKKAS